MRADEDEMVHAKDGRPAGPVQAFYLRCRKYSFCLLQLEEGRPPRDYHRVLGLIGRLDVIASAIDVLLEGLGVLLEEEDVDVHGLEVGNDLVQLLLLVEEGELEEGGQFLAVGQDGLGDELFEIALLVDEGQ